MELAARRTKRRPERTEIKKQVTRVGGIPHGDPNRTCFYYEELQHTIHIFFLLYTLYITRLHLVYKNQSYVHVPGASNSRHLGNENLTAVFCFAGERNYTEQCFEDTDCDRFRWEAHLRRHSQSGSEAVNECICTWLGK